MFCSELLGLIRASLIVFFLLQEVGDAPSLAVFKKHLNNDKGFNFWSALVRHDICSDLNDLSD